MNACLRLGLTLAFGLLVVSGCSGDIECEPHASFSGLFKDGHPSYSEARKHMTCYDSEGNIVD